MIAVRVPVLCARRRLAGYGRHLGCGSSHMVGEKLSYSMDFARGHGMKALVWFELERLTDPENLAKNYGYNIDGDWCGC